MKIKLHILTTARKWTAASCVLAGVTLAIAATTAIAAEKYDLVILNGRVPWTESFAWYECCDV